MTTDTNIPSRKPPRAEPLQPDRPGRGAGVQGEDDESSRSEHTDEQSVDRQREQSEDALKNVREGYG